MKKIQDKLFACLESISEEVDGLLELEMGDCGEVSADLASDFGCFTSECLFESCSDGEARALLQAFLRNELNVDWGLSLELAKLLAARGQLVKDEVEKIFANAAGWNSIERSLFLTYLVQFDDASDRAVRLVEQSRAGEVMESYRDGLFMACYRI